MTTDIKDIPVGEEVAIRSAKGQFLPGVSGNPVGRPVGTRNKTTLVKEFIENALTNELQKEATDILFVAIRKAKDGDNAMIKLLIGDLLSEVRRESSATHNGDVNVTVNNMTEQESARIIEHEDTDE